MARAKTAGRRSRQSATLGVLTALTLVGLRSATAALPEAIDPDAGTVGSPGAGAAGSPSSTPPAASPPVSAPAAPAGDGPASSAPPPPPAGGDAEPAPIAVPDGAPTGPRHRIAFAPRFAYRLGDAGKAITPSAGYGVGGTFDWTYVRPAPEIELTIGVDFGSDRFGTSEQGVSLQAGTATPYASTRLILESTFVLTHTVAFHAGPIRPFLALGAGVGFGDLTSVAPAYKPGTLQDRQLLGRVSVGLDIVVTSIWFATLRADYTAVRRADPLVLETGGELPVFGDLLDINLGLAYRF